jgi:cobalt-zinc-cadmium efflux system membrane fusion protein
VGLAVTRQAAKPTEKTASQTEEHAGGDEHAHAEGEKDEHEETEGLVELGDDQIEAAGIELATASAGSIKKEISFPGEVKLNADNVAHIFPRFAGVVRQVRKAVGDRVRKGEVLAVVESNESLNNYEIRSLIDGTIIERHVTLGEMIREDAECFVVADLSTVWVDINVYPKDLPLVRQGNVVRVSASNTEPEAEGKISYVAPVVSDHTRTATARVVLPNQDSAWRPGTFVTARVASSSVDVPLVVARDAIQTIAGAPSVFVETESGAFRAQTVTLGRKSDKEIEIVSGLKVGERYVTKGTFILKAELGKSEAGHNHDH